MTDTATKVADLLARNWRAMDPNTARNMAGDLKRAGLLAPDVPDVEYGIAVDGGGTRTDGISCALAKRYVAVIADDGESIARVTLDAKECQELGAWLIAAAAEITDEAGQ